MQATWSQTGREMVTLFIGAERKAACRLPLPGIDFKFEAVKNVLTQCLVPQRES